MNNLFFPRWRRRPRLCSVLFLSRRGSPTGGCNDKTQGSLWSGSKRTILRAVLQSPGLALPAVSICQPRSAKRCVSVEGGKGQRWTANQMPRWTTTSFVRFPLYRTKVVCLLLRLEAALEAL